MNISFPNSTPPGSKVETQQTVQQANKNPAQAVGSAGVLQGAPGSEISLSGTGVQALKTQLATLPNIRLERVQALQHAVENGSYKATSQQIAEAIHSDLFGAPSNTGS